MPNERDCPVERATVLVVDDDQAIRAILGEVLEDEGYQPILAGNGREALGYLQPGGQLPDVMLLDLLMPELDGYQVLEYLRQNLLQELPVLIFSAQRPDASIHRALDAELRDFVSKPFDVDELLIRMQRLLRRSPRFAPLNAGVLRIFTLGSLRVYRDELQLFDESWRNKPAKTIFKLLLTSRGQRYPKDVLLEYLWPDADPDVAANRLRVAVHELRKMLGGKGRGQSAQSVIAQQEGSYYFDIGRACWVDMEAFEQQVSLGTAAMKRDDTDAALQAFQAAEALYQGEYLRDDPFFEWTIGTRERVRETHLNMLSEVAALYARLDRPLEAAGFCRKILRLEPWREEVYRHLMEYLAAAGRPHEALRVFEECRRALQAEVEAPPSEDTIRLRDRIADQAS